MKHRYVQFCGRRWVSHAAPRSSGEQNALPQLLLHASLSSHCSSAAGPDSPPITPLLKPTPSSNAGCLRPPPWCPACPAGIARGAMGRRPASGGCRVGWQSWRHWSLPPAVAHQSRLTHACMHACMRPAVDSSSWVVPTLTPSSCRLHHGCRPAAGHWHLSLPPPRQAASLPARMRSRSFPRCEMLYSISRTHHRGRHALRNTEKHRAAVQHMAPTQPAGLLLAALPFGCYLLNACPPIDLRLLPAHPCTSPL